LDIIVVCRKRTRLQSQHWNGDLWATVMPLATSQVRRFRDVGRRLSRNDVRIIIMAQLLRQLSISHSTEDALIVLDACEAQIEAFIEQLHAERETA
jgi:putative DNA methylase